MSWHKSILSQLPSPHEQEPPDLRQDILDELADHLDCALQRELRTTDDERTARQRVLQRFGNPQRIARRLWLDAMKGNIMNQRIMLASNIISAAVAIIACIVVIVLISDQRAFQQTLLSEVRTSVDQAIAGHVPLAAPTPTGDASPVIAADEQAAARATDRNAEAQDAPPTREALIATWTQRLSELGDSWREAQALSDALLREHPEIAYEVVDKAWPHIAHADARRQVMSAFGRAIPLGLHPNLLDVMYLGMVDPSPDVHSAAITFLKSIAFYDFSWNHNDYIRWLEQHQGKTVKETVIASIRDWAEHLQQREANAISILGEVPARLRSLYVLPDLQTAARDVGLLDVFADIIQEGASPNATDAAIEHASNALQHLGSIAADEAYLREIVMPIIVADNPTQLHSRAVRCLDGPDNAWSRDMLLEQLKLAVLGSSRIRSDSTWGLASVLASYRDPSIIPTMIALIEADNSYQTVYGIGYFGLLPLTGVSYDEAHDGPWWRTWWENNRRRFDEPVRSMDIPELSRDDFAGLDENHDPNLVNITGLQHAGENEHMKYIMIGDNADRVPEGGFKLLLILPGGTGSADFHDFSRNIHARSLGEDWIAAQLIAPIWSDDQQDNVVWPNRQLRWPSMEFPTEDFIKAVVADVRAQVPIDPAHVYALGWSSGGPPIYATALAADSPLTGAFVAMSVFHGQNVPPVEQLKTRAFYILHSPDDFIAMRFPEAARDALREFGASVQLQTYQGGHGWHGDMFGMIRRGTNWLTEHSAPPTEAAPERDS